MIAPVNLSVPHVVNSESERTASGGFKCRSCTNIEQKLFVVDSSSGDLSLSKEIARIMKTQEDKVRILIYEVSKENWGNAGILGLDMK
jgi:hypothetical protein